MSVLTLHNYVDIYVYCCAVLHGSYCANWCRHCGLSMINKENIIIIIFFDPGTSFPGCETLSKVCGVWNGYNGDSEIVKVLDRQTALKR